VTPTMNSLPDMQDLTRAVVDWIGDEGQRFDSTDQNTYSPASSHAWRLPLVGSSARSLPGLTLSSRYRRMIGLSAFVRPSRRLRLTH
jgi:hypothetical protein